MADVSEPGTPFDTAVNGARALLQGPPAFWSYSALREIEACPRRYALRRAKYPELWDGDGYPPMPSPAAMFGDIVHDALDALVKALAGAGCGSLRASGAIDVVKSVGGYPGVVTAAMERRLRRLEGNPRLSPEGLTRLTRVLADHVEEARAQVQEYLSRMTFPTGAATVPPPLDEDAGAVDGPAFRRRAASVGTHPEVTLADEDLRLMGRIDLLTVTDSEAGIVDYKTGAEDPSHHDQLTLYALLWTLDRVVNPKHIPVTELAIAYPSHDVRIAVADATELNALAQSVRLRIEIADQLAGEVLPQTRPAPELCRSCPVKGLCSAYWSREPDPASLSDGTWFDYEGIVGPPNGVRSRWMLHPDTGHRQLLLRTPPSAPGLREGARVRLLGIRLEADAEVDATVAVMASGTEVLTLAP